MAAHKKYILTEQEKIQILKDYLVNGKLLTEIYQERYKDKFKTISDFNNYNATVISTDSRLIQLALGCKLPEDGKALGAKNESYWEDESEVLFQPAKISELGQDEQNILLTLD